MRGRVGEQFVDETVLAAAQAERIEAGRRDEIRGVMAAGVRRCEHERHGLNGGRVHEHRRQREARQLWRFDGEGVVHPYIEAACGRAVIRTSRRSARLWRRVVGRRDPIV